jgi:hypothetical protein
MSEEKYKRKLPDAEDAKVTQRTQKRKYQNKTKNNTENKFNIGILIRR